MIKSRISKLSVLTYLLLARVHPAKPPDPNTGTRVFIWPSKTEFRFSKLSILFGTFCIIAANPKLTNVNPIRLPIASKVCGWKVHIGIK